MNNAICEMCGRRQYAKRKVFDRGWLWKDDLRAGKRKVFWVRLQPSWQSDKSGQPFMDEGGKYLRSLLEGTELGRMSHFTSLVKCYRSKEIVDKWGKIVLAAQPPTRQEIIYCHRRGYKHEAASCDPVYVVCFGKAVLRQIARLRPKDCKDLKSGYVNFDHEVPMMLVEDPSYVITHPNRRWFFEKCIRRVARYVQGAATVKSNEFEEGELCLGTTST